MRHLTQAEHEQLLADSEQLSLLQSQCPSLFGETTAEELVESFRYLLCRAALSNFRVTIEHKPVAPLKMGNYVPHIHVQPVREQAQ